MVDNKSKKESGSGQGLLLWTAVLTGPMVWLMQFQARYSLAQISCSNTADLALKVTGFVALLGTVAAGVLSWRLWLRAGHSWPNDLIPPTSGSALLLSTLGMLTSAMFSLVIIAQIIPDFFFATCD
jgi:hypothetical protein